MSQLDFTFPTTACPSSTEFRIRVESIGDARSISIGQEKPLEDHRNHRERIQRRKVDGRVYGLNASDARNIAKTLIEAANYIDAQAVKAPVDTRNTEKLRSRLRKWRQEKSREVGKAASIILHNGSIEQITERLPKGVEDLMLVRGMGETRVANYGDEILKIVKSHKAEIGIQ